MRNSSIYETARRRGGGASRECVGRGAGAPRKISFGTHVGHSIEWQQVRSLGVSEWTSSCRGSDVAGYRRDVQTRGCRRPWATPRITTRSVSGVKNTPYGNRLTMARRISPWTLGKLSGRSAISPMVSATSSTNSVPRAARCVLYQSRACRRSRSTCGRTTTCELTCDSGVSTRRRPKAEHSPGLLDVRQHAGPAPRSTPA